MTAVALTSPSTTDPRRRRRTARGDARAEARIDGQLAHVAARVEAALGRDLAALLLVGGYARGEGGLVGSDRAPAAYNDYDLVAIVRNRAATSLRARLRALARGLSEELGIEVDLWPIDESALPSLPPTLFWLDVSLGGAEVLAGDVGVAARIREITPRDVPHAEAARLLVNRAVGLALSNLEAHDRDLRRARHGHKAVLACGDALLLAADLYAPTVTERAISLERQRPAPAVGDALADAYVDAARFRERPDAWRPPGGETLPAWYARIVELVEKTHLAYEAARVGAPKTPAGYACFRDRLFRDAPDLSLGPLVAIKAWLGGHAPLTPMLGHPRERLARAAVALAYGSRAAGCRAIATRLLGQERGASDDMVHAALRRLSAVSG